MKTKKVLKSIIALALALILSLGVMSAAFAADGGVITWTVDGETVNCTYHSDLEVGTNTIKIEKSDLYYFDLSELENGYYSAKLTNDVFEYFCTPEKSGNRYVDWGDMELIDGVEYIIFNRRENVDIIVAGAHGVTDEMTIEIEYLGESIESVEIDNTYEFLYDYDLHNRGTNEWEGYFNTTVTFTGGKTVEADDVRCYFSIAGVPQTGENTINLVFVDHWSEQVIRAAYISDHISGIEAEIPEGAAAYVYYDYDFDIINTVDEITVNFTDGTSQKVNPNQGPCNVTLPGGREIGLYCLYIIDPDTLDLNLVVYLGGCCIGTIEMDTEKASFGDIAEHFKYNTSWYFESIGYCFESVIHLFAQGEFQEAMISVRYLFNRIGNCIEGVANQIGLIMNFMIR